MKLYSEDVESLNVLTESVQQENEEPEYYLEGVFMQANIKNKNGRIYPMEVMKPEVERYIKECVEQNRAFGELLHPTTCTINLDRVSHKIIKIWQDGDYFKARAKILDTPCGRIVKAMIKEGCQLGVSSRALGSTTRRDGIDYVNSDFHIVTAGDIVYEPSAQTAFPRGLMEDVEWEYDEATGEYRQVAESAAGSGQTLLTDEPSSPATVTTESHSVEPQQTCSQQADDEHVLKERDCHVDVVNTQSSQIDSQLVEHRLTNLQLLRFSQLLKQLKQTVK